MPNYIRVKQINQEELTGFFVDSISSESGLLLAFASGAALGAASGVILNGTVLLTGNQNKQRPSARSISQNAASQWQVTSSK